MKYFFNFSDIDDKITIFNLQMYIENPNTYTTDNIKILFTLTDGRNLLFLNNIIKNKEICDLNGFKDYAILSKSESKDSSRNSLIIKKLSVSLSQKSYNIELKATSTLKF